MNSIYTALILLLLHFLKIISLPSKSHQRNNCSQDLEKIPPRILKGEIVEFLLNCEKDSYKNLANVFKILAFKLYLGTSRIIFRYFGYPLKKIRGLYRGEKLTSRTNYLRCQKNHLRDKNSRGLFRGFDP